MPSPPSEPGTPPAAPAVRRVADVQLRGRAGPLPARAYWPSPASAALLPGTAPRDTPLLLVLLPAAGGRPGVEAADGRARNLAARLGVVVLSVGYRPPPDGEAAVDDAAVAIRWAGDHAAELGASGPLVVVAEGPGAAPAVAAARLAQEEGWPRVARLVLAGPEPDGDPLDAALANLPAVVVADADGDENPDLAGLLDRGGEGIR